MLRNDMIITTTLVRNLFLRYNIFLLVQITERNCLEDIVVLPVSHYCAFYAGRQSFSLLLYHCDALASKLRSIVITFLLDLFKLSHGKLNDFHVSKDFN